MTEDSHFFSLPSADDIMTTRQPERISKGSSGWCELFRVDRGGKFRVFKALKPEYRGQQRYEMLLQKEFEIGYSLSHPLVCEVYSFMETNDMGNVIEMEWIDGISLDEMLQKGPLKINQATSIALQILEALSYIHSRQVIHRDIKPSNIFITHNGHQVKILDFGLSDTDYYSVLKAPGGTERFAAPELLEGREVDSRADIYSFGKVLEVLLPQKKRIIKRCIQKEPDHRYQNCLEIKKALVGKSKKVYYLLGIILAFLLGILSFFLIGKSTGSTSTLPSQDEEEINEESLMETIDELFRQATDMISPDNPQ